LIVAPVGAALFISLVAMLLVMRTSSQFNLFSFGLSFRLGLGLVATLLFLPEMCLLFSRMFLKMSSVMTG
jgi:flagellar biosynthetic protein FliR